jgi:GNAT superfamily N-acetyltransferase
LIKVAYFFTGIWYNFRVALTINSEERKVIIAEERGRIIGFIAGEVVSCHLPISSIRKVGYISGAYVLPEFRGKGVMRTLESEMVMFFQALGLKYAELNFLSRNHIARKSWEALGYEVFREQARKKSESLVKAG